MIKKSAYILFSIILFYFSSNAQSLRYGVKGGMNIAILSGTVDVDVFERNSINFGGFINVGTDRIQFQPELLFSGQGAKFQYRQGNPTSPVIGETTSKLNYLNVPLIGKLFLGKFVNLQFGPQFGILLSAKEVGEISNEDIDDDLKEILRGGDTSLAAGIGAEIKEKYLLDVRLNIGVSDLNKETTQVAPGFENPKTTNVVFQMSFGILL